MEAMRVSAKADYAVRAMVELAGPQVSESSPAKRDVLAQAQDIPTPFLGNILGELRQQGLVRGRPGSDGGYWLGRPADQISIADIVRAVEGPLATVRGEPPDDLDYTKGSGPLREVWIALRANIRQVLESVTLADIVSGTLPSGIASLAAGSAPPTAEQEQLGS